MGDNRVIGSHGQIPWHLPADFKRFKETTIGSPVIMGRKTFASIGKPLPGRTNIVVTRDPAYAAEGVQVVHSLREAIARADELASGEATGKVFVLGGGEIYREVLPLAAMLYITKVHGTFEGDVTFPEFNENEWVLTASEDRPKDEKNPYDMTFLTYERKI